MTSHVIQTPVIIIGSGIAGLLTALKLAQVNIASIVVTKTILQENSSRYAQGGIAAVLPNQQNDSIEAHVADTLLAGAGLSDEAVTRSIVSDGAAVIEDLIALGVPFDRVNGGLAFTKEAAHSHSRILHAGGDATGRSIQDTLIHGVKTNPLITVYEQCSALELFIDSQRCCGVLVAHNTSQQHAPELKLFVSPYTVLATGGIGQLYAQTTNPIIATGDGISLAYHAGANIQDMEFVQFHPTAYWAKDNVQFLVSEALRGEGAILRNHQGEAFAKRYHPDGELAPRDIVTRMIWSEMQKAQSAHVYLDISHVDAATLEHRFPTILQSCARFGTDMRCDTIPVAPAAHYGMGGVKVDSTGKTSIEGLLAVGEVVSSGLHGANRLASNSLLECVVLARRVAQHIDQTPVSPTTLPANRGSKNLTWVTPYNTMQQTPLYTTELDICLTGLKTQMWTNVGVIRTVTSLEQALNALQRYSSRCLEQNWHRQSIQGRELFHMLTTAQLITQSALNRHESRGAHYREDFPERQPQALHSLMQHTLTEKEVSLV